MLLSTGSHEKLEKTMVWAKQVGICEYDGIHVCYQLWLLVM